MAQSGGPKGAALSQLTSYDRHGLASLARSDPHPIIANPKLSPDQRRVAVDLTESDGSNVNLWTFDLGSNATSRLSFGDWLEEAPDMATRWQADYLCLQRERCSFGLYAKNSDGSGTGEKVIDLGQTSGRRPGIGHATASIC